MLLTGVLLTGCEMLGPIASNILGNASKDGISVDAQVGDRENEAQLGGARGAGNIEAEDDSTVNVSSTKNDSNIGSANNVTLNNIPPWVFIIALVGWVLPTPQGMIKWAWNKMKFWKRKDKK